MQPTARRRRCSSRPGIGEVVRSAGRQLLSHLSAAPPVRRQLRRPGERGGRPPGSSLPPPDRPGLQSGAIPQDSATGQDPLRLKKPLSEAQRWTLVVQGFMTRISPRGDVFAKRQCHRWGHFPTPLSRLLVARPTLPPGPGGGCAGPRSVGGGDPVPASLPRTGPGSSPAQSHRVQPPARIPCAS